MSARDAETTLSLTDVSITETQPGSDGQGGFGLAVYDGGTLTVERGSMIANRDIGVLVDGTDTAVTLTDVTVAQMQPGIQGTRGWGLAVQSGASLAVIRAVISDVFDVGAFAFDAELTLQNVRITNIAERDCTTSGTCPGEVDWVSGMGLAALNNSTVELGFVEVELATQCGIIASPSPLATGDTSGLTLMIADSAVYTSAIGFCDQATNLQPDAGLYLDPMTNDVTVQETSFAAPPLAAFLE